MAEVIVSSVAGQLVAIIKDQIQNEIHLVRGVDKEVLNLADELETLKNVLDDAENRRFHDKNINHWLSRLEEASYEMEDILDEWKYALLKLKMRAPKYEVCSFIPSSCSCFNKVVVRRDIAKKIKNVMQQLDKMLREKDRYNFVTYEITTTDHRLANSWQVQSTSFIDLEKVHGRNTDRDILVGRLTDDNGESGNHILSIVGMGGLGKTTLAQLVYNHGLVEKSFDLRIWICVSDPFDPATIAKEILESIKGCFPNTNQLDVLFKHVKESITGKRFLLVLDDVWTEDHTKWEPLRNTLRCGGAGSKILVTTRNERVGIMMGSTDNDICRPRLLSNENCWSLILCRVERNEVEFEEIGKKLAQKCNGLPLAAITLASLLLCKSSVEEWENVLNSEIWKMERVEMGRVEVDIFPHLLLSYNELSPTLKRCFSYCAVFPKDAKIDVDKLIEKWMALGYLDLELKGKECFDVLAMRSLFQDFTIDNDLDKIISCKMHDIVHDFAQFVRKGGRAKDDERMNKTCQTCDPLSVSNVNQFCSLDWKYKESSAPLCDCFTRLRVLSMKNRYLPSIPQGTKNLIHLRWLNLSGNKLSQDCLNTIFQFYYLQTLKLSGCGLEEVSRKIENLIHLRHLDLSKNGGFKELPSEIGKLIQLRKLNLGGNKSLEKLPSEIGNLTHLRHLVLSNMHIQELPSEIGNLIQLRHLNLGYNKSLKELPREIGNLIQLRHLDLTYNESLKELPSEIENLIQLRHLNLHYNVSLKELPSEIGNMIQLRHLDLSYIESLKELPCEIGNLIQLRHLNLSYNECLKELPSEIGNLIQLRHLDLSYNVSLKKLPESICGLHELRSLDISHCLIMSINIPEELVQLTSLHSLKGFQGGSGKCKLRLLKKLNHLSDELKLIIRLGDDNVQQVVEDAREAELRNKIHLHQLVIKFVDEMGECSNKVRMDVIDALEPHPNLQHLYIREYKGSRLPLSWMVSPLNQLRRVTLVECSHMSSLPPFGKLPCLEQIYIDRMKGLEFVGREFLGIGGVGVDIESASNTTVIAFPKLKRLFLNGCPEWKEWEDFADEHSTIMPCLKELIITHCPVLTKLPRTLLSKAWPLEMLNITASKELKQHCMDNGVAFSDDEPRRPFMAS